MPLQLEDLVQERCPWVTDPADPKLAKAVTKQEYLLQPFTQLSDDAVEDITKYSTQQVLLLGELVSYQLATAKATEVAATSSDVTKLRVLKRAKADVVESEFESLKKTDLALVIDLPTLLSEIKAAACALARGLQYRLGLCGAFDAYDYTPPPFVVGLDTYQSPVAPFGDGPRLVVAAPGFGIFGDSEII